MSSEKKVKIITRHAISNYGSVLQSYALQHTIENIGYEAEIIDYIRADEYYKNIVNALLKKSVRWNKNSITRFIYKIIQKPEYEIMGRNFEKYRNKLLKLSPERYVTVEELADSISENTIYCTGSDQVWGEIGQDKFDPAYFLNFVPDDAKKIAYAASFGKTNVNSENIDEITKLLKRYDFITVRENSAVSLMKDMGVEEPIQVLDPTLLLNSSEWSKLINKEIHGKYVLLYQLHSNPEMDAYAKEFAKRAGMKMLRLTPLIHRTVKGGKPVFLPDISEFLAYVKNASYMITDSFHGTAFAINFNVQFVDIMPGETKTRNMSILELTGLTDRILDSYEDYSYIDKKIDYTDANALIERERAESLEKLKEMLAE